jgi:copper chaperone CopZ
MAVCAGEAYPFERSALALTGSDCRESYPAIIGALKDLDGVARVEAGLVPDHVLVDHDGRRFTGDQLAGIVNAVREVRGVCHAAVMRSCITTGRQETDAAQGQ